MIEQEDIQFIHGDIKAIPLAGKMYVWIGLQGNLLASKNMQKIADPTRLVGCYKNQVGLRQLTADVRETERQFLATPAGERAHQRSLK